MEGMVHPKSVKYCTTLCCLNIITSIIVHFIVDAMMIPMAVCMYSCTLVYCVFLWTTLELHAAPDKMNLVLIVYKFHLGNL